MKTKFDSLFITFCKKKKLQEVLSLLKSYSYHQVGNTNSYFNKKLGKTVIVDLQNPQIINPREKHVHQ